MVARRLMYWQVYLHKTVLCAEQMLKQIIRRAKYIHATAEEPLNSFINNPPHKINLDEFSKLDDYDLLYAIKKWSTHEDKVLAVLCNGIINRQLLKVIYFPKPVDEKLVKEKRLEVSKKLSISDEDARWLAFTGEAVSNTYNFEHEKINILFKNGLVKDISEVDDALINQNLNSKIKKYYICFLR